MSPAAHQNAKYNPTVPQLHMYNSRSRNLQVKYFMANHVATINIPTTVPIKPSPHMSLSGEDWSVIYQSNGELTLQQVMVNAVVLPETGKAKEYRHLMKVLDKLKLSKGMPNNIRRLFQVIVDIHRTNTCFSSTVTKSPKAPRSHIAVSSVAYLPIRKRHIECNSQW